MSKKFNAVFALFCVTAAWGLTFPLIRLAMSHVSPYEFVTIRLLISSIVFLPILYWKRKFITSDLMRAAFIFGSLEAACYLTQTIGLQTISSADSAFITALSVIIAPFLAPFFGLSKPRWFDVVASIMCLAGIFILSGSDITSLNPGVFWTLACAVFYALAVNYLTSISGRIQENLPFVGLQLTFGIPLPLLALTVAPHPSTWHMLAILAVLFCATSTIVSYYLQTRFQGRLPVAQTMLIFAFEPVFACVFAFFINNFRPSSHTLIGGVTVLASFVFSQLLCLRHQKKNQVENN